MFKNTNDNHINTGQFIILDCEFKYDLPIYERYRRADPRPAKCRWPMQRVVSASVMEVEVSGGQMTVTAFKSWSGKDEAQLLMNLFKFLAERPWARLVTWGGISTDVPVLRIGAMEHGLKLPAQLRISDRSRHVHLDLCQAMKGGAGDYVHCSEVSARLNIPCKIAGMASSVPYWVERNNYRAIEHVSESDVITTALLLASHMASQGELASAKSAQLGIIRFVRPLRGRAPYTQILGNVADRLRHEINQELNAWMARVA